MNKQQSMYVMTQVTKAVKAKLQRCIPHEGVCISVDTPYRADYTGPWDVSVRFNCGHKVPGHEATKKARAAATVVALNQIKRDLHAAKPRISIKLEFKAGEVCVVLNKNQQKALDAAREVMSNEEASYRDSMDKLRKLCDKYTTWLNDVVVPQLLFAKNYEQAKALMDTLLKELQAVK